MLESARPPLSFREPYQSTVVFKQCTLCTVSHGARTEQPKDRACVALNSAECGISKWLLKLCHKVILPQKQDNTLDTISLKRNGFEIG